MTSLPNTQYGTSRYDEEKSSTNGIVNTTNNPHGLTVNVTQLPPRHSTPVLNTSRSHRSLHSEGGGSGIDHNEDDDPHYLNYHIQTRSPRLKDIDREYDFPIDLQDGQ